jgi:hypothetical protein
MRPVKNSRLIRSIRLSISSAARVAAMLPIFCATLALAAKPGNVMVHGGGRTTGATPTNPVWIAEVVADPKDPAGPGTRVLFREKIGEDKWQEFHRIAFQVVEITNHSSELVVVKDNRIAWAWFSSSVSGQRFSYGPELPERQKMLAVAGDRKNLWAMALPARGAQTQTSREPPPATATTRASAPILYQLAANIWTPQDAPLPAGLAIENPDQVSMTVINENPTIAVNAGDRLIQLAQYSRATKRWDKVPAGRIETGPRPVAWFKVLNLAEQPALWLWDYEGGDFGQIWTPNGNIKLPANPGVALGDADVTVAGDQIWLVYRKDGKLFQQRFNRDGSTAEQQATQVSWLRPPGGAVNSDWWTIGVMTLLTFLILSALLRRRAAVSKEENNESEE